MSIGQDLVQLEKNDAFAFKLLGAGIRSDIKFYIFNTKEEKYVELSRSQLQIIQNTHPKKINIKLEDSSDWILYNQRPISTAHSQQINYLDLWLTASNYSNLKEKNNLDKTEIKVKESEKTIKSNQLVNSYLEVIQDCPSIQRLMGLVLKAINTFPAYKASTPKIRKTGNLTQWIKSELSVNDREAYFITMALSEKYPDSI